MVGAQICSLILQFTRDAGIIIYYFGFFGFPKVSMLNRAELFLPVCVISDIWREMSWSRKEQIKQYTEDSLTYYYGIEALAVYAEVKEDKNAGK